MIDSVGTAKIMDFGIARISDARTCTPTGMVLGTAEYMAPEQVRGKETPDGRADQFALAAVAYRMMTGSTLFGPHTLAALTYKIVNEAPPLPSTRNSALPQSVDAVLARALAKTASERFATCCEFVSALAQAFPDVDTTLALPARAMAAQPTQPVTIVPQPAASAKRSRPVALHCRGGTVCSMRRSCRLASVESRLNADRSDVFGQTCKRDPGHQCQTLEGHLKPTERDASGCFEAHGSTGTGGGGGTAAATADVWHQANPI